MMHIDAYSIICRRIEGFSLYPDGMKAFTVRLPDDLADKIIRIAETEVRSVNQQIEWLLRRSVAEYEAEQAAKPKPKGP
jgi:hypothetical protein